MSIQECALATILRVLSNTDMDPEVHRVLCEVRDGRVTGNKAHRYLGWAQGKIHSEGLITLDEFREINRQHNVDDNP